MREHVGRVSMLPQVETALRQMHNEGMTTAQIAVRLKVNPRTISRWRVAMGIAKPPAVRLTAEEKRHALDLLTDGASYNEVARTIGRCAPTIARHFPGYGWTRLEGSQFGALIAKKYPEGSVTQR